MRSKLAMGILLLATALACGQTNNLTGLLQQGLFEEQANRNLDAAIADYQDLAKQFDKDRQLAATAVFRLGECYRAQGRTNEAAAQYQRIIHEFADQPTLAMLSRQDLAGMGVGEPATSANGAAVQGTDVDLWNKLKDLPEDDLVKILPTLLPDLTLDRLLQERNDAEEKLAQIQVDFSPTNPVTERQQALVNQINAKIHEKIAGMMQALKLRAELGTQPGRFDARLQSVLASRGAVPGGEGNVSAEAAILAGQLGGIEKLTQSDERARAVLAIFPDDSLKSMLLQLPRLQAQVARLKANPQLRYQDLGGFTIAVAGRDDLVNTEAHSTNLLADAESELAKEQSWIGERVDFILGLEQARLKALQSAPGARVEAGGSVASGADLPTSGDEDREIRRIQQMIQNSPDLINADNPTDAARKPLIKAAYDGQLKVAAYLLDHGADVNGTANGVVLTEDLRQVGTVTPLVAAVAAGNMAMTKFLVDRGANVNFSERNGDTPLHLAAFKGFSAVVQALLDSHADINARNHAGLTPLFSAVQGGQIKIIRALLAAGANPNLADNNNSTVLNYAIKTSPEIVQTLLAGGANPNTEGSTGRTPLSYMAEADSVQVVKLMLAAKADPNGGRVDPPLLAAISKRDAASVEALLEAGADPKAMGKITGEIEINGSRYGSGTLPSVSPLYYAIWLNQPDLVRLLLKFHADANDTRTDGQALLFFALDKPEIVKALLDAGASADASREESNRSGVIYLRSPMENTRTFHMTLLQAAAERNYAEAVDLLLQHGANANAKDERGDTVLHYAATDLADETIFSALLSHKADPNLRNNEGKTPLDMLKEASQERNGFPGRFRTMAARQGDASQLVALLRQHGALDQLPDWNHIDVSRPTAHYSEPLFPRDTNHWNHFSLLEVIYQRGTWSTPPQLNFPDWAHVVIARPGADGLSVKRIPVDLLNGTNGFDCARDVPVEFGDVVEIPEREHSLAEDPVFLRNSESAAILNHFRQIAGEARLVVEGGATVSLELQPFFSEIGYVLERGTARAALTSNSDLTRVRVIRQDPATGKKEEWVIDCSKSDNKDWPSLWLRAGDVIDVPLKP